jgi:hypothetical protein
MKWDRYVTPFSYGLWLAIVITVCVLGVCLAVTNYGHERNQNLNVSATYFYIHACFSGQCTARDLIFTFFVSTHL